MRDFKKLQVWQKSHDFTVRIYRATETFPSSELYGLTNQIRRATVSIPSNIAEGCGRDTNPDLIRFLHIAMGSASEVEYQLLLAHDLRFLKTEDFQRLQDQITEIKRMLTGFIKKLKAES